MFLLLTVAQSSSAQELSVPLRTQAELIAKLAAYDRNFRARSGERARVMIVTMKADAASVRTGRQLAAAFSMIDSIGGIPHEESVIEYTDAPSLAKACQEQRISIVYLTLGMDREVENIGRALNGVDVLTVDAESGYAARGAVVELFVEGGKPKLALDLAQARKQHVSFPADLIRLTKVIR